MRSKTRLIVVSFLVILATSFLLTGWGEARVRTHVWIGIGPWWGWYYPPAWYPVYVYAPPPPPPPCTTIWVEGRWERRPIRDDRGFTVYREVWIPGHWERVCQ
jgi:hypothetical protein